MALVGSLLVSIAAKTDELEAGLKRAKQEIATLKESAAQAQTGMSGLGASALGAAAGFLSLGAAVRGLSALADAGLRVGNLEKSFTALTGSVAEGTKQLEFARATANALGKDLESTTTAYRSFFAASKGQLDTASLQNLFTGVQRLAAQTGASPEETQRGLVAVTQALGKGKLAAEEYRGQLLEAIPILGELFPKALGVTRQEMEKVIEKGLDSKTAFLALGAYLSKELPASTDVANKSLTILKNGLFEMAGAGGKDVLRFLDSAAAKFITLSKAAIPGAQYLFGERATAGAPTGPAAPVKDFRTVGAEKAIAAYQADLADMERRATLVAGSVKVDEEKLKLAEKLRDTLLDTYKGVPVPDEITEKAKAAQQLSTLAQARLDAQEDAKRAAEKAARETEQAAAAARRKAEQLRLDSANFLATAKNKMDAAQAESAAAGDPIAELRAKELAEEQTLRQTIAQRGFSAAVEATALAYLHQEQAARAALDTYKEMATEQQERVRSFAQHGDLLGLDVSPEQEARRKALATSQGNLERYEELMSLSPNGTRITAEARRYGKAQRDLAPTIAEGGAEAERARLVLQKLEPEFVKLSNAANDFAESFLSTMERATEGGIKSFQDFAYSVISDIRRILSQQYLRPALGGLVEQGLGLASSVASGYFGGESPYGSDIPGMATGPETIQGLQASIAAIPRAGGGDLMPGRFYQVGENGPELIRSGSGGHVWNQEQMAGMGTTVHVHVSTPDASSFQRSRGEIEATMARAVQQAQRRAS